MNCELSISDDLKESFLNRLPLGELAKDECWEWHGPITQQNFARLRHNGSDYSAARLSFQIFKGSIPTRLLACHCCGNARCVNPHHLFAGTHKDDRRGALRSQQGELSRRAKITEEIAVKIKADPRPGAEVARDYRISQANVSLIRTGKRWKYLP